MKTITTKMFSSTMYWIIIHESMEIIDKNIVSNNKLWHPDGLNPPSWGHIPDLAFSLQPGSRISPQHTTTQLNNSIPEVKARTMLAQNPGIPQLSQAWKISVPLFDSFRKTETKLYHQAFDSSWHLYEK